MSKSYYKVDPTIAGRLINQVLNGHKHACKIQSPNYAIKATRHGKEHPEDIIACVLITVGRPNYEERRIIKRAIKTKKKFPLPVIIK